MKGFAVLLALLLPTIPNMTAEAQSETRDSTRHDRYEDYWDRLEVKIEELVRTAVNGFETFPDNRNNRSPAPTALRTSWSREYSDLSNIMIRYNRVEGLFLGLGSEKRYDWEGRKDFSPSGSAGYGFSSHRWRFNMEIEKQIPLRETNNNQLLEFGVEGHSLTDSKDRWRINLHENNAAAFFIHEDFRDYFGREGVTLHAAYYLKDDDLFTEAKVAYLVDRYESLDNNVDWSLFGGSKVFRTNPAIRNGNMRSIMVFAGFSTAHATYAPPDGWSIHATAEFAGRNSFGGDFTFNQLVADVRRFQPIGRYDQLNLRLRIGTAYGDLPPQKSYELGGFGTLPGFAFKSFPGDSPGGNRMILLNTEYLVDGDFLGDLSFWPSWIMRHLNLVFLADAGLVRAVASNASVTQGFGGITLEEFKSDLGVGVGSRNGSFRLALAWRTDKAESPRILLRFAQPF
jgi:hypothetical protein